MFSSVASHSGIVVPLYGELRPYVKGEVRLLSQQEVIESPYLTEQRAILGSDIAVWRERSPDLIAARLKSGELAIYFDCGTEDEFGFLNHARYFHDRLADLGIAHTFEAAPGKHDDEYFSKRIGVSLAFHEAHFKRAGVYPKD